MRKPTSNPVSALPSDAAGGSAFNDIYHANRVSYLPHKYKATPCAICGWTRGMAIHAEANKRIVGYGHDYTPNAPHERRCGQVRSNLRMACARAFRSMRWLGATTTKTMNCVDPLQASQPYDWQQVARQQVELQQWLENKQHMHYKNGRVAKNGDKVVCVTSYGPPVAGILYDATPGNDTCNGKIAITSQSDPCPNLQECLHADDIRNVMDGKGGSVPDVSKA